MSLIPSLVSVSIIYNPMVTLETMWWAWKNVVEPVILSIHYHLRMSLLRPTIICERNFIEIYLIISWAAQTLMNHEISEIIFFSHQNVIQIVFLGDWRDFIASNEIWRLYEWNGCHAQRAAGIMKLRILQTLMEFSDFSSWTNSSLQHQHKSCDPARKRA